MNSNYIVSTKNELEEFIKAHYLEIQDYIKEKKVGLPIPIYSSVDIREGHEKIAPVDNNIYPAGFNNICPQDIASAVEVFKNIINKKNKNESRQIEHIGIIPESHTKNSFYLDHLLSLRKILIKGGFKVSFLTVDDDLFEENQTKLVLESHSLGMVDIFKAEVKSKKLVIIEKNEIPDFILMNNDQSNPLAINWSEIENEIEPTPLIGWNVRGKINHFKYYKIVADKFASHFGINPDIIQAKFCAVDGVDFNSKIGLENLADMTDKLIESLPRKGKVFVKASQGTYGMGISVVSSGEEIRQMNRKNRNKMDIGKNNKKFTSFLVQEGIETVVQHQGMSAEVAIYLIDGDSVGGFQRVHPLKGSEGNLNSKGMVFHKYCISELRDQPEEKSKEAMYSVIAQLSTLASAYEIRDINIMDSDSLKVKSAKLIN